MLLDSATSEKGDGIPAKLIVNHKVSLLTYHGLVKQLY